MTICIYCGQGATSIDMRDIGKHLRKWRKSHGYTLREVYQQTGVTVSHLSDIERTNRGMSLETLVKLIDLYEIQFVYIPANVKNSRYLVGLCDATDAILVEARRAGIDGAINWGDLSCETAELALSENGVETFRVWIGEASPDNFELQEYVGQKLFDRGYGEVEVITEW